MTRRFPTVQAFDSYLDALNFFHMDLSLDRMTKVLEALNLVRPPFPVVQIVGTNGKGSTAAFLDALLRAHHIKTGLYTSPHFVSPAERIQVVGRWTDREDWLESAEKALDICPDLTYFELLTVVALDVFARQHVEVAILEAGLGAQYDATTATAADCVVFAPIALDHTALLGSTIEAIAGEKSHAIRSAAPVVLAPQFPAALDVLQDRAREFGATITQASPLPEDTTLGLAGRHQFGNAGTALEAFKVLAPLLHCAPSNDLIRKGLARAFVPGRLQRVEESKDRERPRPCCILDGAHNPHGMSSLVHSLPDLGRIRAVVFSCFADKNWRSALGMLAEQLPHVPWHIVRLPGERAEDPQNIAHRLRSLRCTNIHLHPSMESCLASLVKDESQGPARTGEEAGSVLVTGSLYLLAEFYALWPKALRA